MNEPRSDRLKSLEVLAADIRNLHNPIEYLIQRFRRAIAKEKEAQGLSLTRQSGAFWKHVAYADSFVCLKFWGLGISTIREPIGTGDKREVEG